MIKIINEKRIVIPIAIGILVVFCFSHYNHKYKQDENINKEPIMNDDYPFPDKDYIVGTTLWTTHKFKDRVDVFEENKIDFVFKHYYFDYFSKYFNMIEKDISGKLSIVNSNGDEVKLENIKNDKVILFIDVNDSDFEYKLNDFQRLKSESENIGAYSVFIVNFNSSKEKEFFNKVDDGYSLKNNKFDLLNKNSFIVLDENNIIQAVMDFNDITNVSETAMYSLNGNISFFEIMTTFKEYDNDKEQITKIYLKETNQKGEFLSFEEFENNYVIDIYKPEILNNILVNKITLENGVVTAEYTDEYSNQKTILKQIEGNYAFEVKRDYKYNSIYNYKNTLQHFNVYGNNKDEIHVVEGNLNGISIYLESTRVMKLTEIETIIDEILEKR